MPELSVEHFAIVLAHLGHFSSGDSRFVLKRLDVPEETFLDAAEKIPQQLLKEYSTGKLELLQRFQDSLAASGRELAEKQPAPEQIVRLAVAFSQPGNTAATDETLDLLVAAQAPAMPFVVGLPTLPPVTSPPPPSEAGNTLAFDGMPGAALPFGGRDYSHWTIERFASYTAERRWCDSEQVRKAYGTKDGTDEYALIVHFNREFAAQAGLRERWTELVQRRIRELQSGF